MCEVCKDIEKGRRLPGWSEKEGNQALAEGWELWVVDGRSVEAERALVNDKPYGHRPFELQAWADAECENAPAFDKDAWRLVLTRANEGSLLHQKALDFLAAYSHPEFDAIMDYWDTIKETANAR